MSHKNIVCLHPPTELIPFLDVLAEILASSYFDHSMLNTGKLNDKILLEDR